MDQLDFDGATYVEELDQERLGSQLEKIKVLMMDQTWRTKSEIAAAIGNIDDASINARLCDLRKEKFGSYPVHSRRKSGAETKGVWEYQLGFPGQGQPKSIKPAQERAELESRIRMLRDNLERIADAHDPLAMRRMARSALDVDVKIWKKQWNA